ncbi:hypothetical protein EDB87DRAFT_1558653 [Lactarius vividus]|nr:hypothetical protein EDB87DRAFT_1558653 [Lactarius vividus]
MTSADTTTCSDIRNSTVPRCIVCSSRVAIYTCPRCAIRTCSLPCSATHKTHTGCSGVRDKTKFVPLNRYTHGTMMDDYVFLEDMNRRVSGCGQDIVRNGYRMLRGGRGRGGAGRGGPGRGTSEKKRDMLKLQLELRDIEIDLLPPGMERRKLNRSTWDPKRKVVLSTVEYNIHPPPSLDANPDKNNIQESYTLLTHRNNFDLSLRDLFQSQVSERTKGKGRAELPTWVKTLALPHPDVPDTFTPPQFFIRAPLDLLSVQGERFGFIKLHGEQKLSSLLRNKQFVEFPTIEVWEEGAFRGVLLDESGTFGLQREQRPAKRRKLNATKGRAAIVDLLGDYGSEDSDDAETPLTKLGEYEESGAENEQLTTSEGGYTDALSEDDDDNNEDEGESEVTVDPATLLAMVLDAGRNEEDMVYDKVDWEVSDEDD